MESEDDYDAFFEKFVKQAETLGLAAEKREKYVKESFDRLERKREKDEKQKEREMEESRRQKELEMEERRRQKALDREERQIELKKEEREKDREHQLLKEREEREHQLKQRELEIRQAELSAGSRTPQNDRDSHTRLPAFREQQDDIDSYLFRFETHAKSLGWEETRWITYLSALLEGNALNLYHSLAAAGELTYQCLKENLLKTFQCTSENVRQKLRYSKPRENEPFQTFGIELRRLFDRWVALSDITTDVDGLVNLILGEQFLESVSADLATFIRERGLVKLDDMVTAAENYRLSRESGYTIFPAGSCVQEEYVGTAFAHDDHGGDQELPRVGSGFAKRSHNQNDESSGNVTSDAQAYPQGDACKSRKRRRSRAGGQNHDSFRPIQSICWLCREKGHKMLQYQKVACSNEDLAKQLSQLQAEMNGLKSKLIETTAAVSHGGTRRKRSRKCIPGRVGRGSGETRREVPPITSRAVSCGSAGGSQREALENGDPVPFHHAKTVCVGGVDQYVPLNGRYMGKGL
ncbi:uncharacterized protein [Littorina saxatilis]|uniref:uncharacterized protein n=1 Tax=Littorina saxatilis TaxID=31220 RepID=UPI0038B64676